MADIQVTMANLLDTISQNLFLDQLSTTLPPLVLYVIGMSIYAILIFNFYRFIAEKNFFEEPFDEKKVSSLEHLINEVYGFFTFILLYPLIAFAAAGALFILLALLSSGKSIDSILLAAVAVVGAVRVTAYYNEDLSRDLSKMLPFALLGISIIDASFLSVDEAINLIFQLPLIWISAIHYLIFLVALEGVLRFIMLITSPFSKR